MKKPKGYYLRTWKNIGSIIIISGAIVACLINKDVGATAVLIGMLINVSSCLMGKLVYICPECKKKNWCKTKLVSREEI